MANYVKSVTLPGTEHSEPICFAFPQSTASPNVINILCGQNNTGKSFLLEGIRECLHRRWEYLMKANTHTRRGFISMDAQNGLHKGDVYVTMSSRSPQPNTLCFGKSTWKDIWNVGLVGLTHTPGQTPTNRINYQQALFTFSYKQMAGLLGKNACTLDEWLTDTECRQKMVDKLTVNEKLYKCSYNKDLIESVEKILDAKLYFRYAKGGGEAVQRLGQVEFALVYADGSSVTYTQWSDGQRAVFYFFTLISENKPDILLLDEIENHLHPAFISEVLAFIKRHVPQSIITTHHPHVIFSELVDKVIYIESRRPQPYQSLRNQVPYHKPVDQPAPTRRVYTLDSAFEKLAAAYHLFSYQDKQLLYQAQRVVSEAEIRFYHALTDIFTTSACDAKPRLTPDAQTKQLIDALKRTGLLGPLKGMTTILDFGAGRGRVQAEISKLSRWQLGGTLSWVCWDKDWKAREQLKIEVSKHKNISCRVIDKLEDLPDHTVDVCVFANVLHELTPRAFGEIIHQACNKLVVERHILVILELYPLLVAEKFAVSYPPDNLVRIFRNLGFTSTYQLVPIRDTSAYYLVAKMEPANQRYVDPEHISEAVSQEWSAILSDALEKYAMTYQIDDFQGYRDMTQCLTTIASICAWQARKWHSS